MMAVAFPMLLLGVSAALLVSASPQVFATQAVVAPAIGIVLLTFWGSLADWTSPVAVAWPARAVTAGTAILPKRLRDVALPVAVATATLSIWHVVMASGMELLLYPLAGFVIAIAPVVCVARKGWSIANRVVASWLHAIATLNATLPLLPVTPGYLPDHLE